MPFDCKKEYTEFYLSPKTLGIITVSAMSFLAMRGQGDPNEEDSDIGMLYAVVFTIKMSKMGNTSWKNTLTMSSPP